MRKLNLKLKLPKCVFGKSKIAFFGVELSSKGVNADPKKIEALKFAETAKECKGWFPSRVFLRSGGFIRLSFSTSMRNN